MLWIQAQNWISTFKLCHLAGTVIQSIHPTVTRWETTYHSYSHIRSVHHESLHTLSVQNICNPFYPHNSHHLSGHGLYKVSYAFHGDAGPCWLQCFPHSWKTWETVESENNSSDTVLDTLKPVRLAPTTITCSKALNKYVVLPINFFDIGGALYIFGWKTFPF
jgi:hypothetical protein